jgi:hypothetical protein
MESNMKYKIYTEEQAQAMNTPLVEGEAKFEVIDAEERLSSNGNEMMVLTLSIIDSAGSQGTLKANLIALEKVAFKIRHFWESVGMLARYEHSTSEDGDGEINAIEFIGKKGACIIKKQKSDNPKYDGKLDVYDYIASKEQQAYEKQDVKSEDSFDDDVPF